MGVKHIHLINSYKVEKASGLPLADRGKNQGENLVLGLEQAQDTSLPEVHLHKLFKPFVEDVMPQLVLKPVSWSLTPIRTRSALKISPEPTTLAIGPEGGFTDYEIGKFGSRISTRSKWGNAFLRVETAVPALLAKLFPFS